MSIQEVISRRISVRAYQAEPAELVDLEAVRRAGERADVLTQAEMQFHLCTDAQMGREIKGIIGDYGKTIHAPHYIVLASRECEGYLIDAGYRFEQMVLNATERGLGTCWVGLMFKEASLRSTLGLDDSWRMIVLTPIGRSVENSLKTRILRTLAGSKGRKPIEQLFFWQRHNEVLPPDVANNQRLMQVLEAARWAPSWMNKQPWRFVIMEREILVYKVRQQEREGKDYNLLDCGIAMCLLHLAAQALGIWKPVESTDRWKREVHRVGLLWNGKTWETHIIDNEIEKDAQISRSFPMQWSYLFTPEGFSAEMKCGVESEFKGDSDLTYVLGDRPFFDLKEEGLQNHKPVCFAADRVYNNWDCVAYSSRERRFRLWFQQAHAD